MKKNLAKAMTKKEIALAYGDGIGPEMSAIHQQLEALGPRWTGGQGQVECGGFEWFSGPARPQQANLDTLADGLMPCLPG